MTATPPREADPEEDPDTLFAGAALSLGFLSPRDLQAALAELATLRAGGTRATLQELLVERGALGAEQVQQIQDDQGATVVDPCGAPTVADGRRLKEGQASGAERLGRYPVSGVLGAGGMGTILAVRDDQIGRTVACKVMREPAGQQLTRFLREARISGQLEHPNIVPVYELGRTGDGVMYFTMKRIKGEDLASLIARQHDAETTGARAGRRSSRRQAVPRSRPGGPLSSRRMAVASSAAPAPGDAQRQWIVEMLGVFLKVCDALAFAHSRGVIHRDLKPANIMVGEFGEVQVMDWGLARELRTGQVEEDREGSKTGPAEATDGTQAGAVMGTPAYMPPEQAAGDHEAVGRKSDLYSLGAILYELLTLEPPYEGESAWQVVAQVQEGQLVPPSKRTPERHIPWELEAVVLRAMASRPEDRYRSVPALKAEIERYLAGGLLAAAHYRTWQRAAKWLMRHKAASLGLAAVLLASLTVGGLFQLRAARERAAARQALLKLEPQVRLAEAEEILAQHGKQARAMDLTADQKASYGRVAKKLQEVALAYAGWRRLDPGSSDARSGLYRTYLTLGHLAQVSEDYALAEFAFGQAALLDPSRREPRDLAAGVGLARRAAIDRHAAEIAATLAEARSGKFSVHDAESFQQALVRIIRYPEPEAAEQLRKRLVQLTAVLRPAVKKVILEANRLSADEIRAGWKELAGLSALADSWLAWVAPPPPGHEASRTPSPADRAQVEKALERLEVRAARGQGPQAPKRKWRTLFAEAQTRALTPDGERRDTELVLVTTALCRMDRSRPSIVALCRYLGAEWDASRAVTPSIALARLSELGEFLDRLAGTHVQQEAPEHWPTTSYWWARVSAELARTSKAGLQTTKRGPQPATAEQFYRRAKARFYRNDYDGAKADASRAIELDSLHARSFRVRGNARRFTGDRERAMNDLTRAIELDPKAAPAYVARGQLIENNDIARAIADYDRAIELDAGYATAYNSRGVARKKRGEIDGAIADFTRAIQLDPVRTSYFLNRARARSAKGDLAGTIADCTRAIELDPRYPYAYSERGNARRDKGDLEGAIQDHSSAMALDPRAAAPHNNRGMARQALGDMEGAIQDFTRAIELAPKLAQPYLNRAMARRHRRDLDGAMKDISRGIERDPGRAASYYVRGGMRQAQGDHAGALADCTRAIELAPGDAMTHYHRGFVREEQGDLPGAIADYNRAIQLGPKQPAPYLQRGNARLSQGDRDGAIEDYTRFIELQPGNAIGYGNRANARKAKGDLAGAEADRSRAIELDPSDPTSHYNRGLLRWARKDVAGALADFSRAIELNPRLRQAYFNRGKLYEIKKEYDRAIADYTRAIETDPKYAKGYIDRGVARYKKRDLDGAIADWTRAIELGDRGPIPHQNRARALMEQGKVEAAIADYTAWIALAPRSAAAYYSRGAARYTSRDYSGALADYTKAIELDPRYPNVHSNRGAIRFRQGDLKGAMADFTRAVALDPTNWRAWWGLGTGRRALGDRKGALEALEKARATAPATAKSKIEAEIARLRGR